MYAQSNLSYLDKKTQVWAGHVYKIGLWTSIHKL